MMAYLIIACYEAVFHNDNNLGNMLHIYVTGCTGMLGELVGSHTKVAIYPTYAICCKRL